ncbi:MAG: hypothetical protein HY077_17370 [Elusimicrobia bacterium]|nr:hypothetical protein [Elusimicrobiota bacterium]
MVGTRGERSCERSRAAASSSRDSRKIRRSARVGELVVPGLVVRAAAFLVGGRDADGDRHRVIHDDRLGVDHRLAAGARGVVPDDAAAGVELARGVAGAVGARGNGAGRRAALVGRARQFGLGEAYAKERSAVVLRRESGRADEKPHGEEP